MSFKKAFHSSCGNRGFEVLLLSFFRHTKQAGQAYLMQKKIQTLLQQPAATTPPFDRHKGSIAMKKTASDVYIEKAKRLRQDEIEHMVSKMRRRRLCKMQDEPLSPLECVAIQLELEDEQLTEWRTVASALRQQTEAR